jgi:tetratricopeptide (TPR) repeat protein
MKMLPVVLIPFAALAATAQTPSPAQNAIAGAQERIKRDAKQAEPHSTLAKALVRRGRETGDPDYYKQAERAVQDSLRIEPDNFEALKARVMVLLGQKEYPAALELGKKLNQRIPDDVLMYGLIADASMALGDYKEAETSAQWMLDLRRGNVPGMIRGAALRRVFGEVDGALEWFTSSFKLTSPGETEERAWLLTQIARLRLETGKLDLAERLLRQALEIFPDYYFTLEALADVNSVGGKYAEAADLLRRANRARPHPAYLFSLAVALKQGGASTEADRTFAEFERQARQAADKPDNANRQLTLYYADYAGKPAEALRAAQAEIARRRDIPTLDAYAWALYSNGRYEEARAELDKALKIGIRDASLFEHAAAISEKLKDPTAAAKYQRQVRELRP